MIVCKGVPKRNPLEPNQAPKYYASAMHDEKMDLNSLATSVAERCSLRRADVHGVLIALMDILPNELLNGKIVSLGELGSFYVSVKSEGAESQDDMTVSLVKGTKIQYRPTKELKKKLRMVDFTLTV